VIQYRIQHHPRLAGSGVRHRRRRAHPAILPQTSTPTDTGWASPPSGVAFTAILFALSALVAWVGSAHTAGMPAQITLLGGRGRIARLVVDQVLAASHRVDTLVRNPHKVGVERPGERSHRRHDRRAGAAPRLPRQLDR
jgi:hypothetical protein